MERSNEVILQNAILDNVLRYLFDKLKGISGKTIETIGDDGTIYAYCVQNVFPSNSNKIEVKYTSVITPQGNVEKAHGYWGDLIAMSFEGLQLQTNTVLIRAECKHPFIVSIFDRFWEDMLKAFGAVRPVNSKADDQGTNDHPMGNFQPGLHPPLAKKLEAYIENTALDNVLMYINDEIRDKGFHSYTLDNGAVYTWTLRASITPMIRVPFGRPLTTDIPRRSSGKITVGVTCTIEQSGKLIEKNDFANVMTFNGWQRTHDRVKLIGELNNESDFIRESFGNLWASTLKEFKADGVAVQVSAEEPEGKALPRVPKQSKRLNDWKVTWRKVKGRWQGGSNYEELAQLAKVSPETIADIVKAGDAGLLD